MALEHAKSGEIVDLSPLGTKLRHAHTTALVKTDSFEAIRLVLKAGDFLPAHDVSGKLTLLCMEGTISLELPDGFHKMSANQWIYLDGGIAHSLRAVEDSSLLLTIMLPSVGTSLA